MSTPRIAVIDIFHKETLDLHGKEITNILKMGLDRKAEIVAENADTDSDNKISLYEMNKKLNEILNSDRPYSHVCITTAFKYDPEMRADLNIVKATLEKLSKKSIVYVSAGNRFQNCLSTAVGVTIVGSKRNGFIDPATIKSDNRKISENSISLSFRGNSIAVPNAIVSEITKSNGSSLPKTASKSAVKPSWTSGIMRLFGW